MSVRERGGRRETAERSDSMQLTENRKHEDGKTAAFFGLRLMAFARPPLTRFLLLTLSQSFVPLVLKVPAHRSRN